VCIACSQFEKLRARLLAIGQRRGTPEQDTVPDCDQTEGKGQIYICQEMFSLMQEQLKECVSHHRLILEYRYFAVFVFSIYYVVCSVSPTKVWISELTRKPNVMQINFQYFICYCLLCP
jgi:hypothetical protein